MSTVALDAVSVAQDSKHEEVVEAARALVPFLREQQGESDRLGRTPDETAARLQAAGVYSLTTPRAYGGLQTNLTTWMKVITEIGRGDGGVAWGASLINSCNMFGAYFPREVGEEVFAKPGTRLSGVPMPREAKTKRVEGGILIEEGMWMFNSGVYQAHWDLLGVPMVNEAGQVIDHVMAVVPMSDVKILDDWDTIGLRGSGSSSISVENVFVPDARLLSLPRIAAGANDGPFKDESLYKSAMVPVMAIILVFPALGLGMHMLEATLEAMKGKNIAYTAYVNQMEAPVTHLQVGEASAKIDCAKLLVAKACADIDEWAVKGEMMPYLDRARIRRDTGATVKLIWEAVDILASAGGGSFARRNNVLNRIWQDARIVCMHGMTVPATNTELYGRLLCGMDSFGMRV